MIAVLCALAALADLTPARDAISNAEKGKLTFRMTRHTVELSGDECRALAELIRLEGEASDIPSAPIGTGHIFDLVLQVGKGQEVVRLDDAPPAGDEAHILPVHHKFSRFPRGAKRQIWTLACSALIARS